MDRSEKIETAVGVILLLVGVILSAKFRGNGVVMFFALAMIFFGALLALIGWINDSSPKVGKKK